MAHLWSHVRNAKEGSNTYQFAPFPKLNADSPHMNLDTKSLYVDMDSIPSSASLDKNLVELLAYQGDYEARSEVKVLLLARGEVSRGRDVQNLSTLLSTLIKCVLMLGELLKARPHLWQDLDETLQKLGVKEVEKHWI